MLDILRDFSMGQYVPGDSILHRLDPRVKIICLMIFALNIFCISDNFIYFLFLLLILDLIMLAGLKVIHFLRGLRAVLFLLVVLGLMNLFFTAGGTPVFSWKFITVTDLGISRTLTVIFRIGILVMSTTLLTLTTSPVDFTYALEKLLKPSEKLGFPVHEFALMVTISLRFIPVLTRELDRIIKAQMARGISFRKGSFRSRMKKTALLLLPLFINSFKRADELSLAMEVRCYTGGDGRSSMKEYHLGLLDVLSPFLFIILLLGSRLDLFVK